MAFQVLGLGHDPRIFRDADFLVQKPREGDADLVLTYRPQSLDECFEQITALIDLLDLLDLFSVH